MDQQDKQKDKQKQGERQKIKIRLNLIDSIILVVVLAVGGYFAWQGLNTHDAVTTVQTQTITYTVLMNEMRAGTGQMVVPGSRLVDSVKNFEMGTVVSAEVITAEKQVLDHENRTYRTSYLEGYEDVYAVVEVDVVDYGTYVEAGGGFRLRAGATVFLRGDGYMAAGYITQVDRLEG